MYLYPDNLSARATMWLWKLSDLAVIGILVLFSVVAAAYTKIWLPAIITGAFAFLTIRVEDTSILDFIRYAGAYFLTGCQYFIWRYNPYE